MPLELDIYGIYMPGLFGLMLAAYALLRAVQRVAERAGLYALVWHRPLFDLALYVLILGAVSSFASKVLG
ncbi:DUF1656 domain-containing protein [Siccirubricoccus sp. KC 17139]|uniref:DUF1656 domain-containing protein n=1 Tax=Siccirubricoccus soli TaxID=2899147 RepID=A0ABT1D5X0_9PROT|nr:DUF1656 domain-containing protein [Siccirubricoccus soli]MCO6417324.1 DUF1656 domain-containing protein [Siccirubricoccus soli]MCP2683459.1 DUF1656 domain-containing protein [Siccirubricoccus soli]